MIKPKTIILVTVVGGLISTSLYGQGLVLRGQLWGGLTAGNDPAAGRENHEETVGYIPTLSWERQFGQLSGVDFEFAYYGNAIIDGLNVDDAETYDNLYRLWGRYTTPNFELRIGLQKIAFGPGRVLRPLMWFDTLDLRDPTGQTTGVTAVRALWYPVPSLALWGWVVRPDYEDYASPGGRITYTRGIAEFGLTYHYNQYDRMDPDPPDFISTPLLPLASKENRLALDARLDWKIGLWSEMMITQATEKSWDDEKNYVQQIMVGGDYTFAWGDGVYVMVEHLWSRMDSPMICYLPDENYLVVEKLLREEQFTLLMASVPWGFLDQIMAFVEYDWENERLYNFLMWQRTYDRFSLNTILYANPRREDYLVPGAPYIPLPQTLTGFGSGIQFMIVYNH